MQLIVVSFRNSSAVESARGDAAIGRLQFVRSMPVPTRSLPRHAAGKLCGSPVAKWMRKRLGARRVLLHPEEASVGSLKEFKSG